MDDDIGKSKFGFVLGLMFCLSNYTYNFYILTFLFVYKVSCAYLFLGRNIWNFINIVYFLGFSFCFYL